MNQVVSLRDLLNGKRSFSQNKELIANTQEIQN